MEDVRSPFGKIKVLNKKEEETPEELTNDILMIMNVYVAKINGRRSAKNKQNKENKQNKK